MLIYSPRFPQAGLILQLAFPSTIFYVVHVDTSSGVRRIVHMKADLTKLIERVEKAAGPDRDLDWRVFHAFRYERRMTTS
jgi:hypothetical protein